jgi:urea carboxylase
LSPCPYRCQFCARGAFAPVLLHEAFPGGHFRAGLVTTKYNPARTWTPQNAVGIGGAYLCVYGMEGPGGYQFVGRTVQVWSTHRQRGPFTDVKPWLLRFFDRIRWYPVDTAELGELRAEMAAGRFIPKSEDGVFRYSDYRRFLDAEAEGIAAFRARQADAFGAERARVGGLRRIRPAAG